MAAMIDEHPIAVIPLRGAYRENRRRMTIAAANAIVEPLVATSP